MVLIFKIAIILLFLVPASLLAVDVEFRVSNPFSSSINNVLCEKNQKTSSIEVVAAVGEIESASFTICNFSSEVKKISYSGIDVSSGSEKMLSAINIRYVKRWHQAGGAWTEHWRRKKDSKLVPELLVNDPYLVKVEGEDNYLKVNNEYIKISDREIQSGMVIPEAKDFLVQDADTLVSINLPSNKNQQYWLTIDSAGMPPGEYSAQIQLDVNNDKLLVPLILKILPFELKETKLIHSIYYRGVLRPGGEGSISSEYKSPEQLTAEFTNLKSHGIKNPTVYQPLKSKKKWAKYSQRQLDKSLKKYLKIRSVSGFNDKDLFFLGTTTGRSSSAKSLASVVYSYKKIQKIADDYGYSQVYIYGSDEAKKDKLTSQKQVWDTVRAAGGKVFVAGSKGHVDLMGARTDLLVHRDELSNREFDIMHKNKNRVFKYHDPKSGPENPMLFRYKRGLFLWQSGFDGAMDYAYQHSMGFIWNDFDNKRYRDLAFTYPTSNGVIDTIAWEGYREGIDDLNYLATLEYFIEQVEKNTTVPDSVTALPKQYILELKNAGQVDLDNYRDVVTNHIKSLLQWLNPIVNKAA